CSVVVFFFSSRRRHTRSKRDWSSDVCSSDLAVGSHIDTVYNSGMYDGTVGVLAGLEVLFALNEEKVRTTHPLEVIIFACEESARSEERRVGKEWRCRREA